jgi:hypothetical protein
MRLTVVCPSGHSIQATSEREARQIRCPKCQSMVTIPGSQEGRNLQTDGRPDADATLTVSRDPVETLSSGKMLPARAALSSRQQPTERRYRLVGLAACAVALGVIAAIAGLAWRNSRNTQPVKASPPVAERPAEAPSPKAGAQSGPVAVPEPEERYPRIPGAVHRLPDWLARDCPFDANEFSPEIPWEENAAPLYLDAIAEFSAELFGCFPPEQREQLRQRELDRARRSSEFLQRWDNDTARFVNERKASDNAALDQLLAEYQTGLQKLALAQKRRRCLFETGFGIASLLPHAQGSRQVVRILELQAIRDLDRDDVAAATLALEAGLRLSRDLRPRGHVICQLVSAAENRICLRSIAAAILRASGCSREHCDRLLGQLQEHQRQSLDSWTTGLRSEYVTLRNVVNEVQHRTGNFAPDRIKDLTNSFSGSIPGTSPGHLLAVFFNVSSGNQSSTQDIDAINTRVELMSEQEYAQEAKACADWYLAFEPIGQLPRAQQPAAIAQIQARFKGMFFVSQWQSGLPPALEAFRRDKTFLRGTLCLVALKRWQLAHPELPRDLASVLAEAGVKEAPIDPYSGEPFRLATVAGKPVIYSIGPDGVDDHGEFDNLDGRNESGDMLFQLR